ncbi:hypothetical protein GCM10010377_01400 [Streptomyces viridiviolaceus]|nr:hypothetical protein GCM10010377_01400 [Streptomyces viridiviolaceus]
MRGGTVYLLDCDGLSRWVRGERRTGIRVKDAHRLGIRVMTTSMTLIEAYDVRTYLDVVLGTLPYPRRAGDRGDRQ